MLRVMAMGTRVARPLLFVGGARRSAPMLQCMLSSDSKVSGSGDTGDAVVTEPLKNAKGEVQRFALQMEFLMQFALQQAA